MDAHTARLRQQIEQTRMAMAAKLDLLERHAAHTVAATLERAVVAPVQGVQETLTRSATLLHRAPWLIIAGGGLLGYQLSRPRARPARPVQNPAERAAVPPPLEPSSGERAVPKVYDSPRQPQTREMALPAQEAVTRAPQAGPRSSVWKLGGLRVTELARRVIAEVRDDDSLGRAAQLAYYFLFALFPFFLFLVTLLGYLPIPDLLDRIMAGLAQLLPGEALRLVQDNVRQLVTG